MVEKVVRLGVERVRDHLYWIAKGAVWAVPRKRPGEVQGKKFKVSALEVELDLDYIYFLDSDGDVSRTLRASKVKPKPKAKPRPRSPLASVKAEQLLGLLGQKSGAPELERFLAPLGTPQTDDFGSTYHWGFKKHGLELMFKRSKRQGDVLTSIFLFGKGEQDYSAYPGELPHGLAFGQRRRAVEAELGASEGVQVEHPELGLTIGYRGKSGTDPNARVGYLCVTAPSRARKR